MQYYQYTIQSLYDTVSLVSQLDVLARIQHDVSTCRYIFISWYGIHWSQCVFRYIITATYLPGFLEVKWTALPSQCWDLRPQGLNIRLSWLHGDMLVRWSLCIYIYIFVIYIYTHIFGIQLGDSWLHWIYSVILFIFMFYAFQVPGTSKQA